MDELCFFNKEIHGQGDKTQYDYHDKGCVIGTASHIQQFSGEQRAYDGRRNQAEVTKCKVGGVMFCSV